LPPGGSATLDDLSRLLDVLLGLAPAEACVAVVPLTRPGEAGELAGELAGQGPNSAGVLILAEPVLGGLLALLHDRQAGPSAGPLPSFDAGERVLRWRGEAVKCLRREAPTQAAILEAFERAGWPRHLDDPLDREPGLDPKERLRETVKSLNRGLRPGSLRFHTDGTGCGVRWAPAAERR
jgi:hypothetical protein